jgi:hypothetical protein
VPLQCPQAGAVRSTPHLDELVGGAAQQHLQTPPPAAAAAAVSEMAAEMHLYEEMTRHDKLNC